MCLSEWWERGEIEKGDNLILSTFGAGFTWGSIFMKWSMEKPKN